MHGETKALNGGLTGKRSVPRRRIKNEKHNFIVSLFRFFVEA